jgi:hypothetical protein
VDKDRESAHPIAGTEDAQIVYRRSSARPVEYAILLQVRGAGGWETRIVADNSHADRHVDEHHCHRYLDRKKQPAEPLPFRVASTNDAMAKVIDWFAGNWTELTS